MTRLCLVCETELGPDPRSRTCSGRCRVWLYRAGGPVGAARIFGAWADNWHAVATVRDSETAAKLRAVRRFGELNPAGTAAALHLTC